MAQLDIDVQLQRQDFSLAVRARIDMHGITALFGPSGGGKTTLLRLIAGLEPDARGRVTFDGHCWQDDEVIVPAHRRGAGLVFQDTRLFPHLTVAGNLRFAAKRAPAARPGADFPTTVEALDLGPLLDRRVQGLSGGERQRVAIGRTLLARPQLVLMDEPLAALDVTRRADLLPYIESLPTTFDMPFLYVTHALDEVARLAVRTVVMADGRILMQDDTPAVLERLDLTPLTGLPESGVLLDGRVLSHAPELQLTEVDIAGQRLSIPALDRAPGSAIRLRVRARDVALALLKPKHISIRNVLRARVLEIDIDRDTAFAEVLLDLNGAHLRARITRASADELGLRPGNELFALVKSVAMDGEPLRRDV
ncbi:MAG: molybdenum ABC transporter ATP-binding protein [Gammaproteobacteria bacterium]|nr:molybdenum ABC transporter ATP-binding protein [Gammaproteobacteria bacterium]